VNRDQIRREIAAWMEHISYWESKLETARKYDDSGERMTAEEMIRYSRQKISSLEMRMQKGA
jgi:hypothetical protein